MFRKRLNKENLAVVYKLLHDLLFVLLVFFVLALIAEGLLPGVISSHIGLYKIALLTLVNIMAISGLQKFLGFADGNASNKKTAYALLVIILLLLFNSLFKLDIFLNLSILILILVSAYFIFRVFQEE